MAKQPEDSLTSAYKLLYFIAGFNIILGVVALAGVTFLQSMGLGVFTIVYGVVLGILGGVTHMTRSVIPLVIALLILVAEFVFSAYVSLSAGASPTGLILKGLFVFYVGKPIVEQIRARM